MMPALVAFLAFWALPYSSVQKRIRTRDQLGSLDGASIRESVKSGLRDGEENKQYDWKGEVGDFKMDFPPMMDKRTQKMVEAQQHRIWAAFLALPGKTHSSSCKLNVHKEATVELTQSVRESKATMVGQVKGLLMMLCMAIDEHIETGKMTSIEKMALEKAHKKCQDLHLTTAEGVHEAIRVETGEPPSNDAESMHLISDSQKADILKILKPNGPTPERIERLTEKLSMSTKVYMCLINHEATEYYSDDDLSNHTGAWGNVKGFAKAIARGAWKTPLQRLGKKLSNNERDSSRNAKLYTKLLKLIVDVKKLEGLDCEAALNDQDLLMMKGTPETRVGSIDLMSLSVRVQNKDGEEIERSRKVEIRKSTDDELVLDIFDNLMDESAPPVVLTITAPDEDDIEQRQDHFSTLRAEIGKHIEQCKVEKVGVFNVAMKSRLKNKFTWSEHNPWKVVFFSSLATQLFTHDAQPTDGYDLFGDPEEIEQPCKWKARALQDGKYKPVSQTLLWLKDVGEVLTAGENMTFMNYRNSDEGAFIWMDDKNKVIMPEWARGQKGLFNCKAMGCQGRSFPHYSKHFENDVRGLTDVTDSMLVFETLKTFGWKIDPVVNWHVKRIRKSKDDRYDHEKGIVEIRGDIERILVRKNLQTEPLQLSSTMVSSIFPFDDMTASLAFLKVGSLLSTESSSLWSVYDYVEGYHDHCFVWDGSSIGDGNDYDSFTESNKGGKVSRWFVETPFASTIHFCTNSFEGSYDSKKRKIVESGSTVNRDKIIEELTAFYSRGRKPGTGVLNREVKPCKSTTDSLFNTCFGPTDCKENPNSPCPKGYACDCDVSSRGTAMNVGMAISVIAEGTIYMDWAVSIFQPLCVTGVTAIGMPFIIPACPFIAGALGYIQAPFGTNTPIVIAGISIIMGMSSCGCVKMDCSSGAMIPTGNSNRVCALRHPNNMENLNPLAFVPPPGLKCVQGTTLALFDKCEYKKCSGDEMLQRKVQWEQREGKRRVTEIFNCHSAENPMPEKQMTAIFNEQKFIEERPDDKEIREGLVPRPTEDVKLSDLISADFWARIGGDLGSSIRKCFWSTKTRRNLKVYHHGWIGKLAKFPFKLLMSPLCLAKIALTSTLSLAFFLLDYVMGAAVQILLSTVKLLEKIHVNLIRAGRWWQFCDASGNQLAGPLSSEEHDIGEGVTEEEDDPKELEEIELLMNSTNGIKVGELFDQIAAKVEQESSRDSTELDPESMNPDSVFNDKWATDEYGKLINSLEEEQD